jgi:hypothetical protein
MQYTIASGKRINILNFIFHDVLTIFYHETHSIDDEIEEEEDTDEEEASLPVQVKGRSKKHAVTVSTPAFSFEFDTGEVCMFRTILRYKFLIVFLFS